MIIEKLIDIPNICPSIHLATDDLKVSQLFDHLFYPYISAFGGSSFDVLSCLSISIRGDKLSVLICFQGKEHKIVINQATRYEDIYRITCWIIHENLNTRGNWMAYHGAAVCDKQGGVSLLLGKTMTGKTTACAYLCIKEELLYVAEDICILSEKDGRVLPFPRNISLRLDVPMLLLQNGVCLPQLEEIVYGNYERYVYRPTKYCSLEDEIYIKNVYLLNRTESQNRVLFSDESQSYNIWLENSYFMHNVLNNIKNALAMSKKHIVYMVNYSDLKYLGWVIKNGVQSGAIHY